MTYLPPGTMPFAVALARFAQGRLADQWNAARENERSILEGASLTGFHRGMALRPDTVSAQSYDALRPLLADGRLPALLRVKAGPPRPIPAKSWHGEGADDLDAVLIGRVAFVLADGSTERGAVLIMEEALAALLRGRPTPVLAAILEPPAPQTQLRNRGGAPRRYDEVEFVIIAARIAFEDRPANKARLTRAALDVYAAALPASQGSPSDEWARPLIRRLWNGLRLERTDTKQA